MLNLTLVLHRAFEAVNGSGKIGPHEGQIIELMRNGSKPICELDFPFNREGIEILLQDVRDGKLSALKKTNAYTDPESGEWSDLYYFCQPGQEENMRKLLDLFEQTPQSQKEFLYKSAEVGKLLGYSDDDIAMFSKWNQSPICKALVVYDRTKHKIFPPQAAPMDYSPIPIENSLDIPEI